MLKYHSNIAGAYISLKERSATLSLTMVLHAGGIVDFFTRAFSTGLYVFAAHRVKLLREPYQLSQGVCHRTLPEQAWTASLNHPPPWLASGSVVTVIPQLPTACGLEARCVASGVFRKLCRTPAHPSPAHFSRIRTHAAGRHGTKQIWVLSVPRHATGRGKRSQRLSDPGMCQAGHASFEDKCGSDAWTHARLHVHKINTAWLESSSQLQDYSRALKRTWLGEM